MPSSLSSPYIHPSKPTMVLLESPANPLLKIADLALISREVKERACCDCGDLYDDEPIFTKAPGTCQGVPLPANSIHHIQRWQHPNVHRSTPINCFLLLRGVKTITASRLPPRRLVPPCPQLQRSGYQRETTRCRTLGALSFKTRDKAIDKEDRGDEAVGDWYLTQQPALPEHLIRLCVGIEDPTDLLDDLEHDLEHALAIAPNPQQNKYVRVLPAHTGCGAAWYWEHWKQQQHGRQRVVY
ncbi:hypothetical protein BDP27DRAFT_1370526 [Rhodocollybia butyracea]|uniref:Uncharacterized protein n=1 Tax=Rhodocollybia butyracea TaxID=206335 RepID=A0A9P5TYH5_9AGAR|nr:hypothetical protein BDP27DRAFT_1370526 [Rhodocollybia butyracea]